MQHRPGLAFFKILSTMPGISNSSTLQRAVDNAVVVAFGLACCCSWFECSTARAQIIFSTSELVLVATLGVYLALRQIGPSRVSILVTAALAVAFSIGSISAVL